ncbi:MAG: hypothetical protein JSS66_13490 [Armatimonadetes bacterium]|nr:hypothetical protein [Armatimonadota bacterium]
MTREDYDDEQGPMIALQRRGPVRTLDTAFPGGDHPMTELQVIEYCHDLGIDIGYMGLVRAEPGAND